MKRHWIVEGIAYLVILSAVDRGQGWMMLHHARLEQPKCPHGPVQTHACRAPSDVHDSSCIFCRVATGRHEWMPPSLFLGKMCREESLQIPLEQPSENFNDPLSLPRGPPQG